VFWSDDDGEDGLRAADVGDYDDGRGAIHLNDEQEGVSGGLGAFSRRPAAHEGAHQDAKIEAGLMWKRSQLWRFLSDTRRQSKPSRSPLKLRNHSGL
jgi:hypothetical protein